MRTCLYAFVVMSSLVQVPAFARDFDRDNSTVLTCKNGPQLVLIEHNRAKGYLQARMIPGHPSSIMLVHSNRGGILSYRSWADPKEFRLVVDKTRANRANQYRAQLTATLRGRGVVQINMTCAE